MSRVKTHAQPKCAYSPSFPMGFTLTLMPLCGLVVSVLNQRLVAILLSINSYIWK
jgi:hypothetical protein